jgi:hypothetical protein
MTQGLLRSGCRPIDVRGSEIVVAFPYPFLQEKLGDPQRTLEIQDAFTEVFGVNCRLKLVRESEHTHSTQQTPHISPSPAPEPGVSEQSAPDENSPEQTKPQPPLDGQALDKISEWAEKRGGQARMIQS